MREAEHLAQWRVEVDGRQQLVVAARANAKEKADKVRLRVRRRVLATGGNKTSGCADQNGMLPVHYAAQNGHVDVLEWLLGDCDADLGAVQPNNLWTPMHYAAANGQTTTMSWLFDADFSTVPKGYGGTQPVHLAASKRNFNLAHGTIGQSHVHAEALGFLLERGAEGDTGDDRDASAVHLAAATGDVRLLKQLDKMGVLLSSEDAEGQTPMHYAAAAGQVKTMKWLDAMDMELGHARAALTAKCRFKKRLPIHTAAAAGQAHVLKWLTAPQGEGGLGQKVRHVRRRSRSTRIVSS